MSERCDHLYELMIGALNRRDYGAYKHARTAYIAAIEQLEAQVREGASDPYDRDKLKAAVVHVLALSRLDPALVKALSDRLAAGEYRLNRPRDRGTVDVTIYRPGLHQTTADPEHGHREFSDQELRAFRTVKTLSRAMSLTDAAGGYLVAFQLDPTVILTSSGGTNPIRQLARKVVATGDVWSRISSAGITASWDAEAAEVSDDPPTFAQPQVPVWKQSAFVPISIEAYEDEATALTGTASEVDRTGTTLDAVDFFATQEALPARWQANAAWIGHLVSINRGRSIIAGTGLTTPLVSDETDPPRVLGKPIYEASFMLSTVTAAASNYLLVYNASPTTWPLTASGRGGAHSPPLPEPTEGRRAKEAGSCTGRWRQRQRQRLPHARQVGVSR